MIPCQGSIKNPRWWNSPKCSRGLQSTPGQQATRESPSAGILPCNWENASVATSYRISNITCHEKKEKQRRRRKRCGSERNTFHILEMTLRNGFARGTNSAQIHLSQEPPPPASPQVPGLPGGVFQHQGRIYLRRTATVGRLKPLKISRDLQGTFFARLTWST